MRILEQSCILKIYTFFCNNILQKGGDMVLRIYLNEWLAEQKWHIKTRTHRRYAEIAENNIIPILGEVEIAQLTTKQVKCFVAELNAVHADNTVLQIVGVLKRALNCAAQEGIISTNPAIGIALHHKQHKVEPFSESEQNAIVKYILQKREPYYYGIIIALYTG